MLEGDVLGAKVALYQRTMSRGCTAIRLRRPRAPALAAALTLLLGQVPWAAQAETAPTSTIIVRTAPQARPAPPPARVASVTMMPAAPGSRPLNLAPTPRSPAQVALTAAAPAAAPKVLPWVTLAGSVAAGIAGTVFMTRSLAALDEEVPLDLKTTNNALTLPEAYKDQQRRVLTNGILGTVLLSASVAGSVASLISLASD